MEECKHFREYCICMYMNNLLWQRELKGIVHFEIKIWYLSAYPKGIQDVGVFFSSVDPILMFLGQTVLVCQSYNGRYRSLSSKRTCTEFQIKQFPILTTHWWPKTRNERFVWENEQYLYRFLPLVHNHVQVICVRTRIRCVTCVCARSGSCCIHTGRLRQRLTEGVSEAWCWRNFSSANGDVSQSDRLMQIPNPVHATPEKYVIGCCNYDGASAPRFRHALRQALTPTPRVNAVHILEKIPVFILEK